MTRRLPLSIATADYDHVRDLSVGRVAVEGVDPLWLTLPIEEIFHRFVGGREWDVSEMSFAKYVALRGSGDTSMEAIPVFPSRVFRHSAIYVRSDRGITAPTDLTGRRVGIPEWFQTAGVYVRGLVSETHGVDLASIEWVQAGVNQPGRNEKVATRPPEDIRITARPDTTLSDLLEAGEIDAAFSARAPDCFLRGHPLVRRLFADPQQAEELYWRTTGIFPIMHLVVIRREILDSDPWVAMNLFDAFEEAKRRSVERLADIAISAVPLPWVSVRMEEAADLAPGFRWPYGIESNRPTLEAFLRFAQAQGLCDRRMEPEDLFTPSVRQRVRV
jgi:4,5-dihydroxyphthalate decarboxylase